MSIRECRKWARLAAAAAAAAVVSGCGDNPVPAVVLPQGAVVQGPVKDAVIFADEIVADGRGNGVLDAKEKAFSTTTDSQGNWTLTGVPSYDYEMVSIGGTDTITQQPAIVMRAEGGKANQAVTTKNVTPLTTLVQLTPPASREAMKTTIKALGVDFDKKIDEGITPAAAALVKAVTTTATQVVAVLNAAAGGNETTQAIPTTAVKAVQTELLTQLATNLVGKTAADLNTAGEIATITETSTQTAVTRLVAGTAPSGGLTLNTANAAATATQIATQVSSTVTNVVSAIETTAGGALSTSSSSIKPESEVVAAAVQTIQASTSDTSTSAAVTAAAVTVAPPVNIPPQISGSSSASGAVDVAFTYTPTISDENTADILTLSISGAKPIPPGLSFNPATGVISGTPTAAGTGTYTIRVSDGVSSATLTVTLTFIRTTGATGATF